MPDPLVGAAAAKAVVSAADSAAMEAGGLLQRVLGPAADEIGAALGRYTGRRVGNVRRITEKAEAKSGGGAGQVPPRVAHQLLEDGSYCDDELMAEYMGGVLAGGRTPSGRDDRAIVWSRLVTGMSVLQLRGHFLLYREWAARLHGRIDVNLGVDAGREQAEMHLPLDEFLLRAWEGTDTDLASVLPHTIPGLIRIGMLDMNYAYGPREDVAPDSRFGQLVRVRPSPSGIELYGWALGQAGLAPSQFPLDAGQPFAEDQEPRLANVELPRLPPRPGDEPEASESDDGRPATPDPTS